MDIIKKHFPGLSARQTRQLEKLEGLYKEWNEKINVISRKDMGHFYQHHVLHSLAIAKVASFAPRTVVLDAGTGGGFPGIPLAIMFPGATFHLVDSIAKKISVVQSIADELGLENMKAWQDRVEKINQRYDFVVSRAVTQFPTFYHWVKNKISRNQKNTLENGILYLKGGNFQEEIQAHAARVSLYPIHEFFPYPYFEEKKVIYLPVKR
jgi:16S rRNA (guanine527-N7)-methyltransferase